MRCSGSIVLAIFSPLERVRLLASNYSLPESNQSAIRRTIPSGHFDALIDEHYDGRRSMTDDRAQWAAIVWLVDYLQMDMGMTNNAYSICLNATNEWESVRPFRPRWPPPGWPVPAESGQAARDACWASCVIAALYARSACRRRVSAGGLLPVSWARPGMRTRRARRVRNRAMDRPSAVTW